MRKDGGDFGFVRRLIGEEANIIFAAIALAVVSATLALAPFVVVADIAARLLQNTTLSGVWGTIALGAGAMTLRLLTLLAAVLVTHIAAFRLAYVLRTRAAEKLGRMPLGLMSARATGAYKKILYDDVTRIETFIAHHLVDWTQALVTPLMSFILIALVDWRMALVSVAALPIAFAFQAMMFGDAEATRREAEAVSARVNGAIAEYIRGIPVIKAFNQTVASFRRYADNVAAFEAFVSRIASRAIPFYAAFTTAIGAGIACTIVFGLFLHAAGELSVANLILCVLVGVGLTQPLNALMTFGSMFRETMVSAGNVRALLETPDLPATRPAAAPRSAEVRFEAVSFAYGDDAVLREVNCTLAANTVTALVGPSGAGKTTMAHLLCRFWDPQSGAIRIGGADLRQIPTDAFAAHVSSVFQDVFLFNDTVAGNIRVGRPGASDAEIEAAARAAHAHDFIQRLPQGYATPLGERGARLSGGERQRISIARAILKDAPIIVLDEASAFADPISERAIQRGLSTCLQGKTALVIAHRLPTVKNADQIIVMDHGRVVDSGRHDELLTRCGLYRALWASWEAPQLEAALNGAA